MVLWRLEAFIHSYAVRVNGPYVQFNAEMFVCLFVDYACILKLCVPCIV
jgi:hypothetical protein